MTLVATTAPSPAAAVPPPSLPGRRPRGRSLRWIVPMAPAVALLAVSVLVPVGYSLYLAFTNTRLTGREAVAPEWIGLDNFRRLIDSGDLANSAWLTLVFVIGSAIIGQNLLGLALAFLLARRRWFARAVVTSIILSAYVFPEIVPGFMWSSFLSDDGALNRVLDLVGLPDTQILLDQPMLGIILADIWRATAFSMLVYMAALGDIDRELIDAARVDGASYTRTIWHIQLPLLRRTAFTNLMLITLPTLSVFTMIFALTGGGPGDRSETLPMLMYNKAFRSTQDLAYGTAISVVLLGIGGLLSVAYVLGLRPGRTH